MFKCLKLSILFLILNILVECDIAHSVKTDNVLVLTVATSRTDGYERYVRSAREFGIEFETLGLGSEWRGGDVKRFPGGGYKVNLIIKAVEKYKDDGEKIILFTDGYDVVFLADLSTILAKFKASESRVLFSAEDYCWPDASLTDKYPLAPRGKRFLNSGTFMGYAKELHQILTREPILDDGDDQLFYTRAYLDDTLRAQLKMKLDHTSDIFQNLYGAYNDVELQFDNEDVSLDNVAYRTKPAVLHGNGLSKVTFNALTNYLARAWSPAAGCVACQEGVLSLAELPAQRLPSVVLALFVEQPTPFFEEFLQRVRSLDYPKARLHLFVHNAVKHHADQLRAFLDDAGAEYASVKQITPDDQVTEWGARNLGLDHCAARRCDYYFNVDALAQLDNPRTLRLLMEQNRSVVAPLLTRPGKAWSNFWGALTTDGFYARSSDYMDIVHNDRRGLWNVPFISTSYLINATLLHKFSDRSKLGYVRDNFDADMSFCANLRDLDVFMYVSNREDFGHLVNPETFDTTRSVPDMYQIFENPTDWEQRYINPLYPENFNADKKPAQPCPDVYWFPVTSLRFCKDLIHMMESFGQWSDGKNTDSRLEGGYEAVPTRDIHANQVGWERHWLHFLKQYVRPLQEMVFTGYYHDPPRSLMNFVVRYKPDEQPLLRPHHDSSTYTINIALNKAGEDYTGGGCRFIRYNCSVLDTKPGWMLMHPGRLTHFHEGLRVLSGTRYIMISFVDP